MDIKIGDIVGRKSYGCDIAFRVHDIVKHPNGKVTVILKGINLRILADAPEIDIVKLPPNKVNEDNEYYSSKIGKITAKKEKNSKAKTRSLSLPVFGVLGRELGLAGDSFKHPGRVLHLDGDKSYLDMCLKAYKEAGIEVIGKTVPEADQPKVIRELLIEHRPDILVLTGHDGMLKDQKDYNSLDNYRNSRYFIDAVKEARRYEPSLDDLVIFAGACQSMFEGIMAAGANFASSPARILIHALDPVMVCQKIAFTTIEKIVPLNELLNNTISGLKGVGGVQTRGKYRDGMPKPLYGQV